MRNVTEWSIEFDLLWNNIMSNKAPGLNSYEKSLFLTNAQENVVIQLYNGSARESFEGSEEVTEYLASLVNQADGVLVDDPLIPVITPTARVFSLPSDVLFKTFESCVLYLNQSHDTVADASVVPVTQDDMWKIRRNPFKCENQSRVLRLTYKVNISPEGDLSACDSTEYSEIISKYDIKSYTCRYISKPSPIILESLEGTGLSINGETESMTCTLPEVLHQTILTEAVRLAKSAWSSNN